MPTSRRPNSRRASSIQKPKSPARAESFLGSSSEDETSIRSKPEDETCIRSKPKHILKPPKCDGTGSFETFLAQFRKCVVYSQWTEAEKLVYLRGSLEKDTGQVLWDYSAETTNSFKKMKVLKERFGETNQAGNYRIEVKNRRRQPGETLRSLRSDIR